MPAGRPPKYNSPEEMQEKIDEYIDYCRTNDRIPVQGELAYFLGFESRQSLWDYMQKEEFSYIIRRVKLFCENELNQKALKGEANPQIAKLNLITNYNYKEKLEIDSDVKINPVNIIIESAKP